MIMFIFWRSLNFRETLMTFRRQGRMGSHCGGGFCWDPQCPPVAQPLTGLGGWGRSQRLIFSSPLPTLTRETKWKQSWNWRHVTKMILFTIISEKWCSPLLMRYEYPDSVNRVWHVSAFLITAEMQSITYAKFTRVFPRVTRTAYQL